MKFLIYKHGLLIAVFYEEGYAQDFIDYQSTLGKEFTLVRAELSSEEY